MTGPVDLTSGPPDTVLPKPPETAQAMLDQALGAPVELRRDAISEVVRRYPSWPEAWARLGELGRDDVESYANFRVGYHRGLDMLRSSGWKGSGFVRWANPENRGFLSCLDGLRLSAAAIGEADEEARCTMFLRQLDPAWPPAERNDSTRL